MFAVGAVVNGEDLTEFDVDEFFMTHTDHDMLALPALTSNADKLNVPGEPLVPQQLNIQNQQFASKIIAIARPWVKSASPDFTRKELEWINFLGCAGIILRMNDSLNNVADFCRYVNLALNIMTYTKVLVQVDVCRTEFDSWEIWHQIRTLCNNHPNLYVVLDLLRYEPKIREFTRWNAEPVSVVIIHDSVWTIDIYSRKPTLPRVVENLITSLKESQLTIMCGSVDKASDSSAVKILRVRQMMSSRNTETYEKYFDVLQLPLQPLRNNLDSVVYDVFMADPVKYQLYEEAIYQALMDRLQMMRETDHFISVTVIGCGSEGPLVDCLLVAAKRAKSFDRLHVYLVEKNPSAMVTLRQQLTKKRLWHEQNQIQAIQIAYDDVRSYSPIEKSDIIISELLGSFGDNELSPECLDGARKILKTREEDSFGVGGKCIPAKYTSFMAPLSSTRLHRQVSKVKMQGSPYHVPYVVKLHQVYEPLEPKQVWFFSHFDDSTQSNDRKSSVSFDCTDYYSSFELHGLAGFFSCTLYEPTRDLSPPVIMSIVPNEHSEDMTSWFPMYFPIEKPIVVSSGDELIVNMWRETDQNRKVVWYEWQVSLKRKSGQECHSVVHNSLGSSYSIGV